MKPQVQSTVYPETPCCACNEWINYIRKELKKNPIPRSVTDPTPHI